jgi:DnaJ-class molecular chaperone
MSPTNTKPAARRYRPTEPRICPACAGRGLVPITATYVGRRSGQVIKARAKECALCDGTGSLPRSA